MHAVAFIVGVVAYSIFGSFFGLMVLGVGFMPLGTSRTIGEYVMFLGGFVPTGLLIGRIAPSRSGLISFAVAMIALEYCVWSVSRPYPFIFRDSVSSATIWTLQFLYQGVLFGSTCMTASWLGSKWREILIRSNQQFNADALKRAD